MIDTQKLRLRKPEQKDRAFLTELFFDDAVRHNLVGPGKGSAEMLVDEICDPPIMKRIDKIYWIAERREDGVQVGYASALGSTPCVEICFAVSPHHRERGYGYNLVSGLLDHLATIPDVHTIVAKIKCANVFSQRIVMKLGFTASIWPDPVGGTLHN